MIKRIVISILFFPFQKKIYSFLLLFLLFVPVFYLILWSLSSTESYFAVGDFSLKWYKEVIQDISWQRSIFFSIFLAFFSSLFALVLALTYYFYSFFLSVRYRILGLILTVFPVIFPILVYAISLKLFGNLLSLRDWIIVLIGHIIIIFPLQFFILESSKEKVNVNWIYSALTLGSRHIEIVFKIIVPNIKKTLATAFGFGFLMSFDEIVISNFVIDTNLTTVPKKIWNEIDRVMNPKPAVPYLLVLFGVVIILIVLNLIVHNKNKIIMALKNSYTTLKRKVLRPFLYSFGMFILSLILTFSLKMLFNVNIDTIKSIVISFFASFFLYVLSSYFSLFRWASNIIDKISNFRNRNKKHFKRISTDLLTIWIDKTFDKVNNILEGREGESLSIQETVNLTDVLFKNNKGFYFGTDSNTPSEFTKIYPYYLHQNKDSKASVRILLCDKIDLKNDFQSNPKEFNEFYQWHSQNSIELFQVNIDKAENIVNSFHLKSTDIGVWDDDYILAFKPTINIKSIKIKFWFLANDVPQAMDYIRYYIHLLGNCEAKRIKIDSNGLTFENIEFNTINDLKIRLTKLWNINL